MCPVFGDVDPALRGQSRDTEGCKKGMQQGGVVGVPHILEIKLPVVVQNLRGGAEDLWLAVQDPVNARADLVADVIRQWRRLGGQRPTAGRRSKRFTGSGYQSISTSPESTSRAAAARTIEQRHEQEVAAGCGAQNVRQMEFAELD